MGKPGRKSKLNQELSREICAHLEKGLFRRAAAGLVGVDESQISRWYARGSSEAKGIYRQFYDAVNGAESKFQADCLAQMQVAAQRDPRHLQWILSRRFPAEWGRHDNVELVDVGDKAAEQAQLRETLLERLQRFLPQPQAGAPAEGEEPLAAVPGAPNGQ